MTARRRDTERGRGGDSPSGRIETFRDLHVSRKSMDSAMEIFALNRTLPKTGQSSLNDQILRSSRSVPANISEAWRKRRYPLAFVAKLNDSEAEAAETQTHLEIALRCKYLESSNFTKIDKTYEEILAMLTKMIVNPDHWTIPNPSSRKQVPPSPHLPTSPSSP